MKHDIEKNKQTVLAFYSMAFNDCKPREAVNQFVGKEYIQHNPIVADGKESFIQYFEKMGNEWPGKQIFFERVIAEDNMVVVHCRQEWPGDEQYATIDIFRLDDDGKIVEHWDVMQLVPTESKHSNSMF